MEYLPTNLNLLIKSQARSPTSALLSSRRVLMRVPVTLSLKHERAPVRPQASSDLDAAGGIRPRQPLPLNLTKIYAWQARACSPAPPLAPSRAASPRAAHQTSLQAQP